MLSINKQLSAAKDASLDIKELNSTQRASLLSAFADALEQEADGIIESNKKDLIKMDPANSLYDRLLLDQGRIRELVASLHDVSQLPDPTGQILYKKTLENGLEIEKITVALGVVGVIYESRPNVTIDVAALCVQSGNVCLLKGGSDAWNTNNVLVNIMRNVLREEGINPDIIQLLPASRECVAELLRADKYVDILIPRGSQKLIDFVRENAKIPVIETGAGVCHSYVDKSADIVKAVRIVHNAKVQRPSVCNALDTILVDEEIAGDFLKELAPLFKESQIAVHADPKAYAILDKLFYPQLSKAEDNDFGKEFLSLACAVKVVSGLKEALQHIRTYSSKHSECIVSEDTGAISTFLNAVDAAAVYSNASTRFTDGSVFGLGAEIGISTQKLHARGPFALEKLVTEKWIIKGNGQVRQ
jgi:glutamate-5-semialdehyde dehydrogenase